MNRFSFPKKDRCAIKARETPAGVSNANTYILYSKDEHIKPLLFSNSVCMKLYIFIEKKE
jgi:hypothetical protein